MINKRAKDFVHEVSEVARHMDFGRRHSFCSMIFAGVNEDASLNELQQNICTKRINEAYGESQDETYLTEAALGIATFINTCR